MKRTYEHLARICRLPAPIKNTSEGYGAVARWFHWSTAATFIAAYLLVYAAIWIATREHPNYLSLLRGHVALGLLVGILTVPRLLWRFVGIKPRELPGSPVGHILARVTHASLYLFMLLMPLTGYLGTNKGFDLWLFHFPGFGSSSMFSWLSSTYGFDWQSFEEPIDAIHHFLGKRVIWVVVALHATAALYHHFVLHDRTLRRMWPDDKP